MWLLWTLSVTFEDIKISRPELIWTLEGGGSARRLLTEAGNAFFSRKLLGGQAMTDPVKLSLNTVTPHNLGSISQPFPLPVCSLICRSLLGSCPQLTDGSGGMTLQNKPDCSNGWGMVAS